MSSSSTSYGWLAGFAALGGFGSMVPSIPMPEEGSRAREIRLRKEKSYQDLLKAAEERDNFTRTTQGEAGVATAAIPKKRSKLKRAWDKLLTKLHLKKSQPVAPRVDDNWREERPGMWRHAGQQSQQVEASSSPLTFRQDARTPQGIVPRRRVDFDTPSEDVLCCKSSISDDDSSNSSPVAMYGPTDKSQEPESTGW